MVLEFLEKIQKILGEHESTEVDELNLDELFLIEEFNEDQMKSLEKYDSLLYLSLNKIGLKSFKNFPKISSLQTLEVRDNKLDMSDISTILSIYPRLIKLKIGGNPIKNFDNLEVLSTMGELKKLEITLPEENSTKKIESLFDKMKNLEVINNQNRNGDTMESTIYGEDDSEDFDDDEGEDEIEEEIEEDFEIEEESENDFQSDEEDNIRNKNRK